MTTAAAIAPPHAAAPPAAPGPVGEGVQATRNALTLGGTMVVGMGLAMVVRLFVVRMLGPEAFGELRFAENAGEMLFVGLTLGVDTLIRREAAVAPERARGYLRGLMLLRIAAAAVLVPVIAAGFALTGQRGGVVALFCVLGTAQVLVVLNNSYSALEHASGRVGWISRVSLGFKLLWAALATAVLLVHPSGIALALALLAAESLRFACLAARTRRHPAAERPGLRVAAAAAVDSLPFFVNYLAYSLYARLGVWWLGGSAGELEVGWYGAASTIASVAMLGMPLVFWVLVPASARVAQGEQGADGVGALSAGALRMALLVAVPLSLGFGLGAPLWLHALFGAAYLPAAPALRALAPTFVLAYVATVCSVHLIQQNRTRAVATVSVAGLAASVVLNAVLVPYGAAAWGAGGAATGAAYATLGTELLATAAMLWLGWTPAWKGPLLRTAGGLSLAAGCAGGAVFLLAAHTTLAALAGAAGFAAVLVLTRTVDAADLEFARSVIRRKR